MRGALLDYALAGGGSNGTRRFNVIVVGGGASGAGVAWDAASRGLSTLLLEAGDFGHGTSSRSTKLIHGGVRYLAQAQFGLVREALQERRLLLTQAPAHVHPLAFLIPTRGLGEALKFGAGLALYDLLAGGDSARTAPAVAPDVRHAVAALLRPPHGRLLSYTDARFDDTRLLLAVLGRAAAHGACVINHAEVQALRRRLDGRIDGVVFVDRLQGTTHEVAGDIVINASGPGVAAVAGLDNPRHAPAVTLSRGSHVVVARAFWPFDVALLLPRTPDGRIMFVLPWHGQVLLGTTDVAARADEALRATGAEVDEILAVVGDYLARPPRRQDVLAAFAGVRPLAGATSGGTAGVSREYALSIAPSGLVNLYGGKWTTFRRMARECLDAALQHHGRAAGPCMTATEALPARASLLPPALQSSSPLPEDAGPLVPGHPWSWDDVSHGITQELACTVEDVLARRTRLLFTSVAAARAAAPAVAQALAAHHGHDAGWTTQALAAFAAAAADYEVSDRGALPP